LVFQLLALSDYIPIKGRRPKTPFEGVLIEKLTSMSVVVPVVVPFTRIGAPGREAPVSSDTVPSYLNHSEQRALTAPKIRKTHHQKVCVKFFDA